jgi:Protein of unknown function (DUF3501)
MKPVDRAEILDFVTYGESRNEILEQVMKLKIPRRIHLGEHLTLLFENRETIRFQIQEMIRVEQIVKEADIQHEVETYNELLGGEGELGATLLIEIENPDERASLLRKWRTLPEHFFVELEDGTKVYATFDERQVGDDRLSSVQYLKFATSGRVPIAVGCDHPLLQETAALTSAQREALASDLR